MKIGILTFYQAENYGAVLQAYALQEVLKKEGNEVEIIDYRPKNIEINYKLFSFALYREISAVKMIKMFIYRTLTFYKRYKKHIAFKKFRNSYLKLSDEVYYDDDSISQKYDIYIIGSDQVWSPRLNKGFDPLFWGDFKIPSSSKKIVYAASMGTDHSFSDKEYNIIKKNLANFNAISTREMSLCKEIQPLTDRKITIVLDPTLLTNRSVYDMIAQKPKVNKKYVLLFQLEYHPNIINITRDIARQLDAIVIEIDGKHKLFSANADIRKKSITPAEFLGLFKYAECIVSASFHGTSFSLVFEKDFYCITNPFLDRTVNVLTQLQLLDRIITPERNILFSKVKYDVARNLFIEAKKKSLQFLLNSVNE